MGFDHILTAPLLAPGDSGDVFATADLDRINPSLHPGGHASDAIGRLSAACHEHELRLLMDLTPRMLRLAARAPAPRPEVEEDSALDPRSIQPGTGDGFDPDPEQMASAADLLGEWLESGVSGFRCLDLRQMAPPAWKALAAAVPQAVLLAWTPGLTHDEIAALADCGFQATFSSLPWWDYRAPWLAAEDVVLRRVAPPIAPVAVPFERDLAPGATTEAQFVRACSRAIGVAPVLGDGWLMPMGFEFGARQPLDPARDGPETFADLSRASRFDFRAEIAAANIAARRATSGIGLEMLSAPHAAVAVVARREAGSERRLLAINASLSRRATIDVHALGARIGFGRMIAAAGRPVAPGESVPLAAGECLGLQASRSGAPVGKLTAPDQALLAPRVVIEDVTPSVDAGRFAVKRLVGEVVEVEADIFSDGHGVLGGRVVWQGPHGSPGGTAPMHAVVNDRWQGVFVLEKAGRYRFWIEAWVDEYGTYRDELAKKAGAGIDVTLELREGRELIEAAHARAENERRAALSALLATLASADAAAQIAALLASGTAEAMQAVDHRPFLSRSPYDSIVDAERRTASFAAWYELFPRSHAPQAGVHGRFTDVIAQLPRIRDMGFDVLYFPPIHPIGARNRKGRNNSLVTQPGDPGSPYAIGSAAGGHDAVDPNLGTLEDFLALQSAAQAHGMEIAIDFAIQCSPDHPWLKLHPDWFAWRPDGSLRYAENPPKKYEDIVNVDFYSGGGKPELWLALRDVVLFWASHGVRTFRVDNPHTKPLPFWEWLIGDVRALYPDALFLAEAFTRPKMMNRLAKLGFSQSYTYFTWRNEKQEIESYFRELAEGPARDFFRPHLFVNTPDINPVFLQTSGRAGHLIRAVLATTLSGLWGMYNGFELCEATPLPGKEEYLDSEKYQLRRWDWGRPGNIESEITMLNALRRDNPALQTHLGVHFRNAWNDRVLCYDKATTARDNVVLVVVSLDPHQAQETDFECPLWEWGLGDDGTILAEDLVNGGEAAWQGKIRHVRLDPQRPFAIWRLRAPEAGA